MTACLTALAYPMGKPPRPTAADRKAAAAFVDGLIADKRLLPRDRDDMIRSHAVTVMGVRLRKAGRMTPLRAVTALAPLRGQAAARLEQSRSSHFARRKRA